ncbi:metal ABC transporter solute-binding protein, Zn/Mn family [Actinomadura parmotrematis]|uniref:Zinc ABC transporter substrate-binding protein n=1 Tax=Actinomadura parmotrematis TaxID=2864039 RepID=A0ABS7FSY9_9ACTN|nr:zinc ABC transporter substrate-binding protein [Actinomadura parmotrematis]MBW8483513.1 zinc ABC transporter substrate-binding protein [Actinomadura parmotrematis]
MPPLRKPAARRTLALLSAAALGAAALTACGDAGASGDGRTRVVASFYPMAWLSERVGGGAVQVTTLTAPGAEPHDLELTAKQVGRVGKARLVVYVKGVQPAVDDAVAKEAKGRALDAAATVPTLPATHLGEEEDEEHGHGHAEAGYDPHLWLDPARMATVAKALGDRLAQADAAHAADYRARAAAVVKDLTALDGAYAGGLRACKQKTIVTAHAAFGYLAQRYGLRQVPVAGVDPAAEPSPRRLAELTGQVRASGATTVFTETLASPKVADALAREAGVRTAVLDPVEGIAKGSGGDYLSVMRANLSTLRTALECP